MAEQQGNEKRASILPTNKPSGIGFLGSSYTPVDSLLGPAAIGVKAGDSLDSVIQAVKGVGYYTDTIGFGSSSNALTRGMDLRPLGINYFLNTGQKCSNGADMYQYFKGIPSGDTMGKKIQRDMEAMGLPPLKGLAPGMVEDAKEALNPFNLMNAMLGSGYPQCKKVREMVGDMYGHIQDPYDGTQWIDSPQIAVYNPSTGTYFQERWILDEMVDKDTWKKTPKTLNPDGSPRKKAKKSEEVSGFIGSIQSIQSQQTMISTVVIIGLLGLIAYGIVKRR
jgi:hypothetical protein